MLDLPGPGIEPVSPALAGGFLTTAPPGNGQPFLIWGADIWLGQRSTDFFPANQCLKGLLMHVGIVSGFQSYRAIK